MGNEGSWWLLAGVFTLLFLAAAVLITIKIVLLFVREWRRSRGD
jgi:hypothetical protein